MPATRINQRAVRYRRSFLFAVFFLFASSLFSFSPACLAQDVVDRMVATVNGGVRPDLITYSDLIWQLALEPGTPLANPGQQDLNRALQLIISQQLILQEAEKLPTITPTDKEVETELATLIKEFSSQADFQERVMRVGLSAEQLREIVRKRVAIEKYLDFRFRSFTVITTREVEAYYTDIYVPRLRRQMPGVIVPLLDDPVREPNGTTRTVRTRIENILTEDKIKSDIDAFLDEARERAEIVYLVPEFK